MPPIKRIDRESILSAAENLLATEGMDAINARRLATFLNSSVQPIFYNFKSMDDLKDELINRIYGIYQKYMNEGKKHTKPYKGMGLAYIGFARDYPNYFKEIFMRKSDLSASMFITNDDVGNDVIKKGMELTGFTEEEQKKFHLSVWVFTHGLACLVATNTVNLDNDEVDRLLERTVKMMILGKKELDKWKI